MRCKVAPGKRVYWQGKDRLPGEIIDMPNKEARINIKLGQVIDAEKERPLRVADPVRATAALKPEDGVEERPKRGYRRRDMTAEDPK